MTDNNCESCKRLQEERKKTGSGVDYCCQAHYYQYSPVIVKARKQRENAIVNLKKEIFDTIYKAGQQNLQIDENESNIAELLTQLEDTYY